MVNVTSLAAFKRFLAQPGATVIVKRHDWCEAGHAGWNTPEKRAAIYAPRTVAKLQGNAVKFSNNGWLYFDKSCGGRGAAGFRFEGDTVTLDLTKDGSFAEVCIYELREAA